MDGNDRRAADGQAVARDDRSMTALEILISFIAIASVVLLASIR